MMSAKFLFNGRMMSHTVIFLVVSIDFPVEVDRRCILGNEMRTLRSTHPHWWYCCGSWLICYCGPCLRAPGQGEPGFRGGLRPLLLLPQ